MRINGVDYDDKELDFTNVLCDLEDIGIDIMDMAGEKGTTKIFSMCRGIVSVYTGEKDLRKCGKILSSHISNGGTLEEIVDPFTKAMESAGFGKAAKRRTVEPQDHKKPMKKEE